MADQQRQRQIMREVGGGGEGEGKRGEKRKNDYGDNKEEIFKGIEGIKNGERLSKRERTD